MIAWFLFGIIAAAYVGWQYKHTPSDEREVPRIGILCIMMFCIVLGYMSFTFLATFLLFCWLEDVKWFKRVINWLGGK